MIIFQKVSSNLLVFYKLFTSNLLLVNKIELVAKLGGDFAASIVTLCILSPTSDLNALSGH